jgi:putative endonuclease
MSYYVYIIQSLADGAYYIGYTHDLTLRLEHHRDGWTQSTKNKGPWELVYIEEFSTKSEAIKRERQIKSMKSRKYIESLIRHAGGRPDPSLNKR